MAIKFGKAHVVDDDRCDSASAQACTEAGQGAGCSGALHDTQSFNDQYATSQSCTGQIDTSNTRQPVRAQGATHSGCGTFPICAQDVDGSKQPTLQGSLQDASGSQELMAQVEVQSIDKLDQERCVEGVSCMASMHGTAAPHSPSAHFTDTLTRATRLAGAPPVSFDKDESSVITLALRAREVECEKEMQKEQEEEGARNDTSVRERGGGLQRDEVGGEERRAEREEKTESARAKEGKRTREKAEEREMGADMKEKDGVSGRQGDADLLLYANYTCPLLNRDAIAMERMWDDNLAKLQAFQESFGHSCPSKNGPELGTTNEFVAWVANQVHLEYTHHVYIYAHAHQKINITCTCWRDCPTGFLASRCKLSPQLCYLYPYALSDNTHKQRSAAKKGTLDTTRRARLEGVHFVFDASEARRLRALVTECNQPHNAPQQPADSDVHKPTAQALATALMPDLQQTSPTLQTTASLEANFSTCFEEKAACKAPALRPPRATKGHLAQVLLCLDHGTAQQVEKKARGQEEDQVEIFEFDSFESRRLYLQTIADGRVMKATYGLSSKDPCCLSSQALAAGSEGVRGGWVEKEEKGVAGSESERLSSAEPSAKMALCGGKAAGERDQECGEAADASDGEGGSEKKRDGRDFLDVFEHVCGVCFKTFKNEQGVSLHKTRYVAAPISSLCSPTDHVHSVAATQSFCELSIGGDYTRPCMSAPCSIW